MPTFPIPVFVACLLFFCAARLWYLGREVSPLALLLLFCAGQSLIIALSQHYGVSELRFVQPITASLIPPMAWLAYLTSTGHRPGRMELLHGLAPLTAVSAILIAPQFLDVLLPGMFVLYGVLILNKALQGADAQPNALLSSGDIPARIWVVIGVALIASALSDVLIVASQIAGHGWLRPWIISLFSVGNLLVIGIVSLSPHLQTETVAEESDAQPTTAPDAEVWEAVQTYMDTQRPYLDPDLTLARLARKMRLPAKALSTTINRATGNNVSRYINAARIKAAQDAILAGESVTSAMLSSGFNTKSNFNREFRRITGDSPSGWAASAQKGAQST